MKEMNYILHTIFLSDLDTLLDTTTDTDASIKLFMTFLSQLYHVHGNKSDVTIFGKLTYLNVYMF
jgi:hypothetical protein